MNLKTLSYLVAVADHGHFGRAAKACFVSQPTLSAQIKKLEDYLNIQLIEREHSLIHITPAGQEIIAYARDMLSIADKIQDVARYADAPTAGDLRIGLIHSLGPYLLPHIVPLLTSKFDKLNLLLFEDKTENLLTQLREAKLDAIILAVPVFNDGLVEEKLFDEPFYVAIPDDHSLVNRKRIKASDLENEVILLLEDGHCLRDQALDICHRINIKTRANYHATSVETLRQMVAAKQGLTLLPGLAIDNTQGVTIIPFNKPVPHREIAILWRATSPRAEGLALITKYLQANLKLHFL